MKKLALLCFALFGFSGSAWAFTAVDVSSGSGTSFAVDVGTKSSVGFRVQYIKLTDGTTGQTTPIRGTAEGDLFVQVNRSTMAVVFSTPAVSEIQNALPAGTNNIGDVDVLSVPTLHIAGGTISSTGTITVTATQLDIDDLNVADDAVQVQDSTMSISGIQDAFPAGDNNIGNVDIVTLPATPVGTNNIGTVSGSTVTHSNINYSMYSGSMNVTTAGTAVAISGVRQIKSILITARPSNTGNIAVGDSTVSTGTVSTGNILPPGSAIGFDVNASVAVIFIDSAIDDEGVSYNAFQ